MAPKRPSFFEFMGTKAGKIRIYHGRKEVIDHFRVRSWVPTGCLPLDLSLGGRGLPTGRIVLLSSEASKGKSLLGLHFMRAFQLFPYSGKNAEGKKVTGGFAHLIETEGSMDMEWAEGVGVKLDDDHFAAPELNTLEEVFEYIEKAAVYHSKYEPDRPVIIFWDSMTATRPGKTLEQSYPELVKNMGLKARLASAAMEKLEPFFRRSNVTPIIVSQLRAAISHGPGPAYGDPLDITGGNVWKFYNSLHLRLREVSKKMGGGAIYPYSGAQKGDRVHEPIGFHCESYTAKSKIGIPFRKSFFPIYYQAGWGHPLGIDNQETDLIWLRDRNLVGDYDGKDKKLRAAKAESVYLPSETHHFVDLSGWKKLYEDDTFVQELRELIISNSSTRGIRDTEEHDEEEEESGPRTPRKPNYDDDEEVTARRAELDALEAAGGNELAAPFDVEVREDDE